MSTLFHIVTLGCPKNLVDSQQITAYLLRAGYIYTEEPSRANIILVNTCGFIEDARKEAIETILYVSRWKEEGACKYLVVTGCLVQKYADELAQSLPEVDILLGTGDLPVLVDMLEKREEATSQILQVGNPNDFLFDESLCAGGVPFGHYAYIKIAEGCNNCCTYCVIPSLRGKYRSRRIEAIYEEALALSIKGVKEIILVAQDTTYYGYDLYKTLMLPQLLKKLVSIPQLQWIRLLYCYPNHLTDDLLQTIKEEEKICSYLDIPLQHISNRVLQQMGRRQTKEEICEIIKKIREMIPGITLRSTFIVGFPGETRADFKELFEFLQDIRFERAGFFKYSQESGTKAAELPSQISENEKEHRYQKVLALQDNILTEKQAEIIGKKISVLVDGPSQENEELWEGRTEGDAPEIDGVVYFKPVPNLKPGNFVDIIITHSQDFYLVGEIKSELSQ